MCTNMYIKADYIDKGINSLLKSYPESITIKTLNVLCMMKMDISLTQVTL
jgi:hypothetical protein